VNLGMLMAELGRMPEAEAAFRTAFQTDPHSAQAAYNLGVMLMETRPDEAMEWCRKAAEAGPENPRYGFTYAFYLYRSGRFEDGLGAIRPVRERFPGHAESAELEQALIRASQGK
jgi:Flp pilus assembly protein TadD